MICALEPLSGTELVRLWNAGYRIAALHLIAALLPPERARFRRDFICQAARLELAEAGASVSTFALARRLHGRMSTIQAQREQYVDLGLVDGCLLAALLVGLWELPSAKTVQRALDP